MKAYNHPKDTKCSSYFLTRPNSVAGELVGAGITDRAMWTGATESGHRVVRLCAGRRTLLEIGSSELATMPDDTLLLSRLQTALNRAG